MKIIGFYGTTPNPPNNTPNKQHTQTHCETPPNNTNRKTKTKQPPNEVGPMTCILTNNDQKFSTLRGVHYLRDHPQPMDPVLICPINNMITNLLLTIYNTQTHSMSVREVRMTYKSCIFYLIWHWVNNTVCINQGITLNPHQYKTETFCRFMGMRLDNTSLQYNTIILLKYPLEAPNLKRW